VASALPGDWATRDVAGKVTWLETQPLPSDPTISLGFCYTRGTRLNVYCFAVFQAIQLLKGQVKGDSTLTQYANHMMAAFMQGVGSYSNAVSKECQQLLDKGKYDEKAQPLTPMMIPGVGDSLPDAKDVPTDVTTIWNTGHNIITMLTQAPSLKQPRPGLGNGSWADLFHAFLDAGKKFWDEWHKRKVAGEFQDVDLNLPVFTGLQPQEPVLPLTIDFEAD